MKAPEQPSIADGVRESILKVKGHLPTNIDLDSRFDELGIDSLDAIEIMFELEERFAVAVPTEAIKAMRTVRDVVAGVEQLLSQRQPEAEA